MGRKKKGKKFHPSQPTNEIRKYRDGIIEAEDKIEMAPHVIKIKNMIRSNNKHSELKISEQDARIACNVVKHAVIKNPQDCFLFYSSLNLLNSYVKKPYAVPDLKSNYFFKPLVGKGIDQILANNIQNVRFSATKSLCMINVEGLQFSYHYVYNADKFNNSERNHLGDAWEGIRLQPYALEIFKTACSLQNISEENKALIVKNTHTSTVSSEDNDNDEF